MNLSLQGAKEIKIRFNKIKDIEILGPMNRHFSKSKKIFVQDLLIRFSTQIFAQKKL